MKPSQALAMALDRAYLEVRDLRIELAQLKRENAALLRKGEGPPVNQAMVDAYHKVCDELAGRNEEIAMLKQQAQASNEMIVSLRQRLNKSED